MFEKNKVVLLVLSVMAVLTLAVIPVSAASDVQVNAQLLPEYSISVTNTLPSIWTLTRGLNTLPSDSIKVDIQSTSPASLSVVSTGFLSGTSGQLSSPMKLTGPGLSDLFLTSSPLAYESITGVAHREYGLEQSVVPADMPGNYSATITFALSS